MKKSFIISLLFSALTVLAQSPDHQARVEKRQAKREAFEHKMDSLIEGRKYMFVPNSMQGDPNGFVNLTYSGLYYIGVYPDHLQVHLPIVHPRMPGYIGMLNFDTFYVSNYQKDKIENDWMVSFEMKSPEGKNYLVNFNLNTITGECKLNILMFNTSVQYIGNITSLEDQK